MGRKQPTYPPAKHTSPDCNCTGKVCSGCGQTKCLGFFHKFIFSRDGCRSKCKECRKGEYLTDENRARRRSQYHSDIESAREYKRNQYKQNPERERGYRKSWRERHAEQERAYQAKYNRSESRRQYINQYRREHPEITINYRNRKRKAGEFTAQEWIELKRLYSYSCICCGRQEPDIKLTPDHVIPLVKGGANTIDNLQPLCITCNKRKGTKTTDYR